MPLPTELASTSDVRNGENPLAVLNEREDGSAEEWVDGDVETAISCDQGSALASRKIKKGGLDKRTVLVARGGSIQRGILMPHDKHRNLGPILALIPNLLRNEIVRGKALDLSRPQQPPFLFLLNCIVETVLVDERRIGEAREGGKEPRLLSLAINRDLPDELFGDSSDPLPVLEVIEVNLIFHLASSNNQHSRIVFLFPRKRTHVFLVHGDQVILNQDPNHELRILLFGDQILLCELWIRDVDRDDLLSRCVLISRQIEQCTVVSDASDRSS